MKYEILCSNKNSPRTHPNIRIAIIESINDYADEYFINRICSLLNNNDFYNRRFNIQQIIEKN